MDQHRSEKANESAGEGMNHASDENAIRNQQAGGVTDQSSQGGPSEPAAPKKRQSKAGGELFEWIKALAIGGDEGKGPADT